MKGDTKLIAGVVVILIKGHIEALRLRVVNSHVPDTNIALQGRVVRASENLLESGVWISSTRRMLPSGALPNSYLVSTSSSPRLAASC